MTVIDHAAHTSYTDPGEWAHLLDPMPTDAAHLSAVVRNLVVHYRASGESLPPATAADIHLRWVREQLATDQRRHSGAPLHELRPVTDRLQGCCRDHSLLCVSALRHKGIQARTRVGFASYLSPDWYTDHVIVEVWDGREWMWFDPEVEMPTVGLPTPLDIPTGEASPFVTAARAWQRHRGGRDVSTYGVAPGHPASGAWYVRNYVIAEVAHRFGDELLLWDTWGAMAGPEGVDEEVELLDLVAGLLVAADDGDGAAEVELLDLYRADARLHPGSTVRQVGPDGSDIEVAVR